MQDCSSRPQTCPTRTTVRKIVKLRWRQRLGPVQIGGRLGLPASTVHTVLGRNRLNRLSHIDRISGEPLRRYEHDHPGLTIQVDVTKFANIRDDGGHRYVGRRQSARNQRATPGLPRGADYKRRTGIAFLHTVVDDHSRQAYIEISANEQASTAVAVLRRAAAWYAERSVELQRVYPTTAPATAPTFGATPTPSSRSPTSGPGPTGLRRTARSNGDRALANGWTHARHYDSDAERRAALPG